MQETQTEARTTNGSIIQKNKWYVYIWAYPELPDGFISEAFDTYRQAKIESGACGKFHRESYQYYTCNRYHVIRGDQL